MEAAWKWLESHWKSVAIIALAVILFIALSWLAIKHQETQKLRAQLEYLEIMKVEDISERSSKIDEFAKRHKGDEVSYLAYMWLGSYYHGDGDLEKAAESYNQVIKGEKSKLIHFIAIDAIVPVYVDMGKPVLGAELYLESAKERSNPSPYLSMLKAAYAFELADDSDQAKGIYEDLITDENTPSTIKTKAEEGLLWAEVSK